VSLKARRKRRRFALLGRIVFGFFVAIFVVVLFAAGTIAGLVYSYSRNLPDINKMADFQPSRSTRVYARDGTLLASLFRQNRIWVSIDRVPVMVRRAFVATEDRNFYTHHGIDVYGIMRAAWADYRHDQFQGASTITQQLARKLFLSNEVSISRKIEEALLAIEIERYYTKDEILERYLNLMYFGSGAYGIQAAAHTYFGTDVNRLSLGQAAMIAGMLAAPSDYTPYVSLQRALERQHHVLDRMVSSVYVSRADANAAASAPLALIGERPTGLQSFRYPYFTTYVDHVLEQQFGVQATYEGGLEVDTTLDPHLQDIAAEAVAWGVAQAKAEGINANEAALVAIRPATGEIVAMVGGARFTLKNQFNRAWQALRQPGSSFKPFVYTAAIDSGMPPTTLVDDARVSYPMGDGSRWVPNDDDMRYMGPITLRTALAQSRNVVAVKLAQMVGVDRVIEYAHRMGVHANLEPNLSLALGTSVVSPLDMASGFATIADQGIHIEPTPMRLVRDSFGSIILDDRFPQENEVFSAGTAYLITSMMESVIKEGTGTNADIGRPAAGKTGTTSDYRDAWFVGFTPDLSVAVWLGNDNYAQMYESYGGNIPARTWARFMSRALAKVAKHDFPYPAGEVKKLAYCGARGRYEYFLADTPTGACASGSYYSPHHAGVQPAAAPVAQSPASAAPRLARQSRPAATAAAQTRPARLVREIVPVSHDLERAARAPETPVPLATLAPPADPSVWYGRGPAPDTPYSPPTPQPRYPPQQYYPPPPPYPPQ
jgi:penicillin-binding protein 1A